MKDRAPNFSFKRPAPCTPFDDHRVEGYARQRAADVAIRPAARSAGVSLGSAQRFEHNEHVLARVAELREAEREYTTIKMGALMQKLWTNAADASTAGDFKASNQAIGMLLALIAKEPNRVAGVNITLSSTLASKEQLRELLGAPEAITVEQPAETEGSGEAAAEGDDRAAE